MFFLKDGFCRKGDQCQFNHNLNGEESQLAEEQAPSMQMTKSVNIKPTDSSVEKENLTDQKSKKKCIYFKRNNCRSNESCPYLHENRVDNSIEKSKQGVENDAKKDKSAQLKKNGGGKNAEEKEVSRMKAAELINFQKGKEDSVQQKNFEENSTNEMVKKNQYCSFFLTAKGCFRGEKCVYLHPLGEKEVAPPPVNDHLSLQKTEFNQLEKRFAADNKFTLIQSEPSTIYSVHFEPSDPDWVGFIVVLYSYNFLI